MTVIHLLRGKQAEWLALKFLKKQGLHYLNKNYRCYQGEIDLIMRDQSVLVFVEVRYRTNPGFGSAIESISPQKIQRIDKAAQHFLQAHPKFQHCNARFDAIGIDCHQKMTWIQDAFTVQYRF